MKVKTKKLSHTYWHNRLDKRLSQWIKEANKECVVCHRQFELQVSHLLPKGRHQGLRYDLMNILAMCGGCHRFFWHDNPTASAKWFEENYPERKAYLDEAKKIIVKRDLQYYKRVEKAIEERNILDLLILKLPIDNQK
jgi:5-methylcytosine-specific restriction endonuclease McrA